MFLVICPWDLSVSQTFMNLTKLECVFSLVSYAHRVSLLCKYYFYSVLRLVHVLKLLS